MSTRVFVLLVLLLTLLSAARWPAVWYAYPFEGFVDEPYLVEFAYAMARDGDPNPHFFNYGSLSFYLCAALYLAADWLGAHSLEPELASPDHFVLARMLVLVLGTLAVPATAELGRRLVSPLAGLSGACFFAVAPLYTTFSYMATVNPPLALWSALTGVAAALVYTRGRTSDYVLAGVLAGMTVGTKYIGFTAALLPVLAHLLAPRAEVRRPWRPLLISMALVPLVFLFTTPFALLDFETFSSDLARTGQVYTLEGAWHFHQAAGDHSWADIAKRMTFRGLRWAPMSLAGIGLLWLSWRDWRKAVLIAATPLVAWLFLGTYKVFFPRNLLGALPYLALLAGCGVHALHAFVRSCAPRFPVLAPVLAPGVTLLVFAAALSNPLGATRHTVREALRVDTRRAALEWVTANVPAGARILREERTPALEELSESYDVVAYRSLVQPDRVAEAEACDWVLITVPFRRSIKQVEGYAQVRAEYEAFMARHELAARFDPKDGELTGRRIDVFRVVR